MFLRIVLEVDLNWVHRYPVQYSCNYFLYQIHTFLEIQALEQPIFSHQEIFVWEHGPIFLGLVCIVFMVSYHVFFLVSDQNVPILRNIYNFYSSNNLLFWFVKQNCIYLTLSWTMELFMDSIFIIDNWLSLYFIQTIFFTLIHDFTNI